MTPLYFSASHISVVLPFPKMTEKCMAEKWTFIVAEGEDNRHFPPRGWCKKDVGRPVPAALMCSGCCDRGIGEWLAI
jgi:hypothetical protein